jgi:hypothetical protein
MRICWFLLCKFKYSLMHENETYYAKYYVNLSCYVVFTTTLTYVFYLQAHFNAITTLYNCDRLSAKGTEESDRNEL